MEITLWYSSKESMTGDSTAYGSMIVVPESTTIKALRTNLRAGGLCKVIESTASLEILREGSLEHATTYALAEYNLYKMKEKISAHFRGNGPRGRVQTFMRR